MNFNSSLLSQAQANELYEGSEFEMANFQSQQMNLFLTSIFFMPIFPLAPIIGCFGMLSAYWVDKYLLLRRHKRPEELSGELSIFFANIVPYCCLLQAISMVLFSEEILKEYNLNLPEG